MLVVIFQMILTSREKTPSAKRTANYSFQLSTKKEVTCKLRKQVLHALTCFALLIVALKPGTVASKNAKFYRLRTAVLEVDWQKVQ